MYVSTINNALLISYIYLYVPKVKETRLKMLFSLKMTSSTDMTDKSCKVDNPDMTLTLIDYDLTLT